MIVLKVDAEMCCSADGCSATFPAKFVLGAEGRMMAIVGKQAKELGWDQAVNPSLGGLIQCRCPAHPFQAGERTPSSRLIQPAHIGQVTGRGSN